MASTDLSRLATVDTQAGDLEIGYTEAIQQHYKRRVVSRKAVSQAKLDFERRRPRWLRECIAEACGVFFYVYPGIASVAAITLASANPETASMASVDGSVQTIGFAFGFGIAFAIIVCASVTGGHFNPAVTISFAVWQGFPWRKVPYYIFSQIFGAFIAGLLVMGQYHEQISAFKAASIAAGKGTVYTGGPAYIFVTIPLPDQTNEGYLFLIEFFVDSFIGLVIWAALDPANLFVSPSSAPFTIGLAYTLMIWGFSGISISTNLARDLGCRIVAAIFFGGEVFSYHNYAWISILVNVPATLFATGFYELVFRDSLQRLGTGHVMHEGGNDGLRKLLTAEGVLPDGENARGMGRASDSSEVVAESKR